METSFEFRDFSLQRRGKERGEKKSEEDSGEGRQDMYTYISGE